MEQDNDYSPYQKQRHGCVTAWLVLMIIGNALSAVVYMFASHIIADALPHNVPIILIIVLGAVAAANVVFAVFLLQWKKMGFWGFCITSVIVLVVNLSMGINAVQCVLGLLGLMLLYGILQAKKDSISAWDNLE